MLHFNDSCYYVTKALLLGVLVSDNRMEFMMGGFDAFVEQLPASDEQTTTTPGDIMLYQGDQISIFTDSNTWAYTPLGHIDDATSEDLLAVLGDGDVEVTLSISD